MTPRIAPGRRSDVGLLNAAILRLLGLLGPHPPRPLNVFTTLARHRGLFRRWLLFAGGLMPGGTLPRRDTELVILRVAHNCGSGYELAQHERLAKRVGLGDDEVARAGGPVEGYSHRQALLLRTADALHADRDLSDELWDALRAELPERECIELLLLIGHYEMLAMTLTSLRVQVDAPG